MGDGTPSKWLGNPSDYGVQTRCLVGDPVYALSASFDAYRLTTLAVCKKGTSPLSQSTCSRDDAWWYPQVPRTYPDLSFTSNYIDYYRYRVYCWVHFGGTGGVYLRSLIGISATFGTLPKGLRSIEFSYSGAIIPDNCRRLGTCCSDAQIDFAIDGPGGERIEHIYFDRIYETFMIKTNKGRSCFFHAPGDTPPPTPKKITIPSGTSITGIYAANVSYCNYADFGVISEVTERDN